MKFFWIINGRMLKQTLLIVTAAFIAAAIAFMHNEQLAVFSTEDGPRAISKIDTDKKQLALTFDIGWGDVRPMPILKLLKKEGVQATFFVSGSWAEQHPDIVKNIVKGEHELASHGFAHKDYRSMKKDEMKNDMLRARKAIKKASGVETMLLRTPKGNFDEEVLTSAEAANYTVIDWSLNSRDITNPGTQAIVNNVVGDVSPGDIVLMHASDSAKQTEEALPVIIDELKDEGYTFVTVSKLLSNAKTETRLVK